jgi:hypothetical protein
MSNDRTNRLSTAALLMLMIFMMSAVVIALPDTSSARDPGINQPGAAGNVGGVGPDPGINQPGPAGNVGRDPGINQPGPAGNRRGVGR